MRRRRETHQGMATKIYTKGGDAGKTSLWGGRRVEKNDARIEAYGTVDELNAWVGWLADEPIAQSIPSAQSDTEGLRKIQDHLFRIGGELASPDGAPANMPQVGSKEIVFLEAWIDRMEAELPALKTFILPGGGAAVSRCHMARTVCRRAERRVVALENANENANTELLAYLNRLSDYFFVLGRAWMQRSGAEEIAWPLD
ncbi:MAG: cob(I)yrinic acid a,c-diamide adenosyltransferase [Flavobacteriales bacterium]|nr:cob(I)yrinic acid a,c-diamide adenosyltransferase [Flavobacteriales bacterium]